ncbi:MAG TPA: bifunctional phosphoribosyl-AMP cyclohydrolase/phosphoribosyl-ATP diphosphatase HisIE [Negativicutes bacterium]|nr:bifunctional phosphoribosyl-AMP cyclohydrolase/phosphoribosyl-ATP diphosphatase HisIE [Negativicutes bacterium]
MMERIRFDEKGLVPAVVQDIETGTVLMLAYMNRESLAQTIETGTTWFYSRSRQELWNKGATSGHVQQVREMYYDCDGDTLLVKVEQTGAACHEGTYSCFSRKFGESESTATERPSESECVLPELYGVIENRRKYPKEGSYTNLLFEKGQDKILKKVGEEAAETIIASKNNSQGEVLYEMADLWYHCLVLLAWHGINLDELLTELGKRRSGKTQDPAKLK